MSGRVLSAKELERAVFEDGYSDNCGYLDHHLDNDISVGDIKATIAAYQSVVAAARKPVRYVVWDEEFATRHIPGCPAADLASEPCGCGIPELHAALSAIPEEG